MDEKYMVVYMPPGAHNRPREWVQFRPDKKLERLDLVWEIFEQCRTQHAGCYIRIVAVLEQLPPWH